MGDVKDLRDKLHQYIDVADEEKLKAIYILLEGEIEWHYTSQEIEMLHKRRENHLKGNSKSYGAEESINEVRKKKK
jgi:hypothetical protein